MSDIVDDLENAEDRIGVLHKTLRELLECIEGGTLDGIAIDAARAVLAEGYERPTCGDDCDIDTCGAPRHDNQTFNDDTGEWEDDE